MTQFGIPPSGNMVNFQPPSYNPMAGPGFASNPLLQLAMAMYLPQAMGQGNFLPSLTPAQHLFDQHDAAKYQSARMQGMAGAQAIDQRALTTRMLGLAAAGSDSPMTAMNVEQASNMASIVNHPLAKMVVGQLMGPENMEDLYYGRRGSAEMMYQSVAKSGFHRRDPTGGERMSAESLSGMTREMYAQMYGPDADLSEMNGISAGRAGVLYDDLFRRGVLPQSIGNLKPSDRVKAISESLPTDDKTMERLSREYAHEQLMRSDEKILDGKRYADLTPQQQQAEVGRRATTARGELESQFKDIKDYNAGTGKKSIGEIEQMEGFGIAARSVDAQKASGTLKQYSGAIAAVREIFGDNGNPNAPMQQLINALEALTQNQIGRVSPKKIEQQVREMQLAARGAGVGLNGMMALSSQAAAFGDQLGLDRSFANTSTLAGMRQGEAMRNAGAINRGFGGMSQEEAMLKGTYLESAAAASPIGNMIGVAVRTVKENTSKHYDANGKALTPVGAMVQALERGDTTYQDPTTGKTVDIQQGLADKQSAFIRDELDKTEDKRLTEERMLDRQGNQEFTSYVKDLSRITQRADITGDMASTFDNQLSLEQKGFGDKDRRQIGKATAAAVMATHSGIAPEARNAHMREKIMQNLIQTEEAALAQTSPNLTPEERRKEATQRADTKFSKAFGNTQEQQMQEMGRMLAQGNRMLTAVGEEAGMTMYNLKDFFGSDVQENKARLQVAQSRRAELMGDFGDTQSTMLQRFSDVLGGLGSGDKTTMGQAVQAMLGVIPNSKISDAMRPGAGALFQLAGEEYNRGIVTNEEELISLRQAAQGSDANAAAAAKEKLRSFAGEKGKGVEDVEKLFEIATDTSANKKVAGGERNIGLSRDIIRGLELGGSAGVSRASGALAQSLLGQDADKDSVNALSEALRSGDETKVTALLPTSVTGDQSDAGKQRMKQILAAAGALKQLDESGRGLGETDSQKISEARLRTVRDVVAGGDEAMLSQTEEGRRLVAMSKADDQGNYTLADGTKRNVHTDLGGGEKEDSENFKRDLKAAADKADQKTKDKVDAVLQQGDADPAQQMASVGQQVMEGLAGAMGGGISSANITIQSLQTLAVQNATGLKLPEGTNGKITGSSDAAPTRTPASVGAAVDAQTEKKRADAVTAYDAAMTDLGKVAQAANVPLQDLINGQAHNKLSGEMKEKAEAAVAKVNETAKTVNELHAPPKQKEEAQTDAQQKMRDHDAALNQAAEKLTASQQAEVEYVQAERKLAEARATIKDPKATPEQKKAAEEIIQDRENSERQLERQQVVAMQMAEEAGISVEDGAAVDLTKGVSVNGHQLNQGEFYRRDAAYNERNSLEGVSPAARQFIELIDQKPKETSAVPAEKQQAAQQEEIDQASKISQERSREQAHTANESRKHVKETVQTEEQKKLGELDTAMRQSWSQLTASQKDEVMFLRRQEKYAQAQATVADPKATDEQKETARNFIRYTEQFHEGNKERDKIVGKQMAEEAGIDISRGFKMEQTLGSLTINGQKLDHREHYRRSRAYDSGDSSEGVSDAALVHMDRIHQTEEQEEFVKSQDRTVAEGKQDKKQTEEKQEQADKKAETKQRDVALAVPTVEERKEAKSEVDRAEAAKQVVMAEQQSGRLTAAGGMGGSAGGSGEQELTGTLQLRGLTEVLLAARSKQMELPEGGGAAIDPAQGQGGYVTAMA
jgi:hypothetical protein